MIAAHYLTVPDVVAVQGALCGRYGARPGVRNLPLLRDTLAGLKEGGHADLMCSCGSTAIGSGAIRSPWSPT